MTDSLTKIILITRKNGCQGAEPLFPMYIKEKLFKKNLHVKNTGSTRRWSLGDPLPVLIHQKTWPPGDGTSFRQ